jgi:hypothetical protein
MRPALNTIKQAGITLLWLITVAIELHADQMFWLEPHLLYPVKAKCPANLMLLMVSPDWTEECMPLHWLTHDI